MSASSTPWEETCQGFRRAMAMAIATEELPDWVAGHLNRCSACRRGLAYVVGRSGRLSRLSERERGLAVQVAFAAKVRGLSREIADLHRARRPDRRRWHPLTRSERVKAFFTRDWRVGAAVAMGLALASASFALYLLAVPPAH